MQIRQLHPGKLIFHSDPLGDVSISWNK